MTFVCLSCYNRTTTTVLCLLSPLFNYANVNCSLGQKIKKLPHELPEVESSSTSLASRTHFQVLGLEALGPQKLPCPWLEDSAIFLTVEIFNYNSVKTSKTSRKICEHLFCFSQLEHWRSQGEAGSLGIYNPWPWALCSRH